MGRRFMNLNDEIQADILYLLKERYNGDVELMSRTWNFSDRDDLRDAAREGGIEETVPGIEELKADAYRQLKRTITRTADPNKLANTIKILEDMKERTEDKSQEEQSLGVAASIESLMETAPPEGLREASLSPVAGDHVKRPRRRKEKPSEEVNGLDENSDNP